jgi:hypothetical protein
VPVAIPRIGPRDNYLPLVGKDLTLEFVDYGSWPVVRLIGIHSNSINRAIHADAAGQFLQRLHRVLPFIVNDLSSLPRSHIQA